MVIHPEQTSLLPYYRHRNKTEIYRDRQIPIFCGKCFKTKLLNIFSNFALNAHFGCNPTIS